MNKTEAIGVIPFSHFIGFLLPPGRIWIGKYDFHEVQRNRSWSLQGELWDLCQENRWYSKPYGSNRRDEVLNLPAFYLYGEKSDLWIGSYGWMDQDSGLSDWRSRRKVCFRTLDTMHETLSSAFGERHWNDLMCERLGAHLKAKACRSNSSREAGSASQSKLEEWFGVRRSKQGVRHKRLIIAMIYHDCDMVRGEAIIFGVGFTNDRHLQNPLFALIRKSHVTESSQVLESSGKFNVVQRSRAVILHCCLKPRISPHTVSWTSKNAESRSRVTVALTTKWSYEA